MKAIPVPVGEMPKLIEIDGSLKSMQKAVGGNVEPCSWVFNDEPVVYVNEEGKLTCEPNRAVYATCDSSSAILKDSGLPPSLWRYRLLYRSWAATPFAFPFA